MKSQIKLNLKMIIPALLLLLVGCGIGYYVGKTSAPRDYAFYWEDTANSCGWKHGKMISTAAAQRLRTVRVLKKDVPAYMHEAKAQGKCVFHRIGPTVDFVPKD